MTDKQKSLTPEQTLCRLCGEEAGHVFSAEVLGRYAVGYFRCDHCGLIQSEEPYWLEEAYCQAISSADTGIMERNLHYMKIVAVLLRIMGMRKGTFLDYGGGHGLFTRLMRDQGFDFRWWDPHAENIFARGFKYTEDMKVQGVTAFEVLEHLEDPHAFFSSVLGKKRPDILFVSTETYEDPVSPDWHYFYFATGQHIAIYHHRTLKKVASEFGYRYCRIGSLHIFTTTEYPGHLVRFCVRAARYLYSLMRFDSLVLDDHQKRMKGLNTE